MDKHSSHILDMARKGAEHKYDELKTELGALVKHFPHLSTRLVSRGAAARSRGGQAVMQERAPRKRRKMSAKARKAVSERMTKFWAAKRKAKKE